MLTDISLLLLIQLIIKKGLYVKIIDVVFRHNHKLLQKFAERACLAVALSGD
jgi:hypothetical protein